MKSTLFTGIFLLAATAVFSQGGVISGAVVDSTSGTPLLHAAVLLQRAADSMLVSTALTDDRGGFRLNGIPAGRYRLRISYLGYRSYERALNLEAGAALALGTLNMLPQDYKLQEVTVREERIPVTVKKDTLEFDAAAFQVRENAVVEELLKKLPGVEVERDGTVRAMGEQVQEVTVDGNPFFGNDPKVATRNLPANIIDKVQVIDKPSDQAQFSGMDDGSRQKAINLTLKKDKKNGLFGNVELGGGTQERFGGRLNLNRFQGGDQLSLIGSGNNINELGFSLQDAMNFGGLEAMGGAGAMGGGGGQMIIRMGPGGGGSAPSLPGSNTGITTSWSGGLNFRDQWGKKLTSSGSYFFNQANTANDLERRRQNLLGDGQSFDYLENSQTDNGQYAHRFNLNMEYKLDSLTTLQFKPTFSLTGADGDNQSGYSSLDPTGRLLNGGQSRSISDFSRPTGRAELLYRQRFSREGRTLSAFLGGGFDQTKGDQRNESFNNFFRPDGQALADTIQQLNHQDNQTLRSRTRLVYTEPLGRNKRMEFYYEWNKSWQDADRQTFDFNPATNAYDQLNDLFTNRFENEFTVNEGGVNLRFQKLRYDFTLGARVQDSRISSVTPGAESSFQRSFFNVFPQALFNYNFSTSKRFRFSYQPDTREPSLTELQPVPDNSNPQFIRLGNAELKPEFAHRFNLNYHHFDMNSMRSLFANAFVTATSNKIVNANRLDEVGRQITQPVNADGALSASGFVALGFPLKAFNLNLSSQVQYEEYRNFINDAANDTRTLLARQTLRLSYSIEERFDAGLAGNLRYNRATYSLQEFLNNNFFNYGVSIDASWTLPVGLRLQGDADYSINSGGSELYNNRALIVNATLAYDFLRNDQGTLELRVFDLLNQNNSIFRNTGANYVEDVTNTTLNQYFMLRFRYRFGQFGGAGFFPGGGGSHMRMLRF